jgi:hypothetical protein
LRPLNHESISLYRVSLKSACQPSARRVSACEAGERVLSGLSRYAMSSSCGWQGIPRRRSASCAAARRGRESPSSPVPATWRGKFLAEFPEFSNERPNEDFHVSLPGVIRRLLFKYFLGGKFARERSVLLNIFWAENSRESALPKIGKRIGERIGKRARAATCCARCTSRAALTRRASHAAAPRHSAQHHSACDGPLTRGIAVPFSSRF